MSTGSDDALQLFRTRFSRRSQLGGFPRDMKILDHQQEILISWCSSTCVWSLFEYICVYYLWTSDSAVHIWTCHSSFLKTCRYLATQQERISRSGSTLTGMDLRAVAVQSSWWHPALNLHEIFKLLRHEHRWRTPCTFGSLKECESGANDCDSTCHQATDNLTMILVDQWRFMANPGWSCIITIRICVPNLCLDHHVSTRCSSLFFWKL